MFLFLVVVVVVVELGEDGFDAGYLLKARQSIKMSLGFTNDVSRCLILISGCLCDDHKLLVDIGFWMLRWPFQAKCLRHRLQNASSQFRHHKAGQDM